jgi:phage terminase large subunit-like protein
VRTYTNGAWIPDWLDEAETFPQPEFHDDQVDAVSGAKAMLSKGASRELEEWS